MTCNMVEEGRAVGEWCIDVPACVYKQRQEAREQLGGHAAIRAQQAVVIGGYVIRWQNV